MSEETALKLACWQEVIFPNEASAQSDALYPAEVKLRAKPLDLPSRASPISHLTCHTEDEPVLLVEQASLAL